MSSSKKTSNKKKLSKEEKNKRKEKKLQRKFHLLVALSLPAIQAIVDLLRSSNGNISAEDCCRIASQYSFHAGCVQELCLNLLGIRKNKAVPHIVVMERFYQSIKKVSNESKVVFQKDDFPLITGPIKEGIEIEVDVDELTFKDEPPVSNQFMASNTNWYVYSSLNNPLQINFWRFGKRGTTSIPDREAIQEFLHLPKWTITSIKEWQDKLKSGFNGFLFVSMFFLTMLRGNAGFLDFSTPSDFTFVFQRDKENQEPLNLSESSCLSLTNSSTNSSSSLTNSSASLFLTNSSASSSLTNSSTSTSYSIISSACLSSSCSNSSSSLNNSSSSSPTDSSLNNSSSSSQNNSSSSSLNNSSSSIEFHVSISLDQIAPLMLKCTVLGQLVDISDEIMGFQREFGTIQKKCGNCGTMANSTKRCTGCSEIVYCDSKCQKEHWLIHKPECKKQNMSEECKKQNTSEVTQK